MGTFTHGLFTAMGRFMDPVVAPSTDLATVAGEITDVRALNARAVADRDALIAKLPRGVADGWVQQRAQLVRDVNDPAKAADQRSNRAKVNELDQQLVRALEQYVDRDIMQRSAQHPYIAVLRYADDGMFRMWSDHAAEYRTQAGFVDGWKTTAKMYAAMGTTLLRTQTAKASHERLRPYQSDPVIQQLGHLSIDTSYPSGHTANAYAAASVLSDGWKRLAAKRTADGDMLGATQSAFRAQAVERDAFAMRLSRMSAGMHHESDVDLGMAIGMTSTAKH